MNLPNDFFAKRLAAIELEKAHYAAIPLLVDCIEKMQLAGQPNRKSPAYFDRRSKHWTKGRQSKLEFAKRIFSGQVN